MESIPYRAARRRERADKAWALPRDQCALAGQKHSPSASQPQPVLFVDVSNSGLGERIFQRRDCLLGDGARGKGTGVSCTLPTTL